ncbi:protease complex subunit PrcB family protein [Flavobacterium chilense]|uniref:Type IV secretion system putative lipoprotein virB7 n=1 Tax=Flavobacterium chilense TaxID=946677 RepID=A0A1M7D706_9FLAO|nr:protease complex subunit PrcB family protein [Flavobacterium chilense]SHL75187.1 PrcB C-terminal [Flavobacterium chilense]
MKQIITFFSIIILLTGCSNDNNSNQSNITFSVIAQKDLSPSEQKPISETKVTIKDAQSWNAFTTKLNVVNEETKFFSETNIDFTKYQIIAVIDQKYGNGGHSIDITQIIETRNKIFVNVEKLHTGNLTSVITQPYHIVKIAKSEKKVVFN